VALVAGAALAVPAGSAAAAAPGPPAPTGAAAPDLASSSATTFVVMAASGRDVALSAEAEALGLKVIRRLGIIHGFTVSGSAKAAADLAELPGVLSVSPDRRMRPMSVVSALGYDPADLGSSSSVTQLVNAQALWAQGVTGKGVDVAVIDTGVTPVAGLNNTGQVVTGPDLSFDSVGATTPGLDAFGHGTFMAGLIAGRDATATGAISAKACKTCLNGSGYSDTTKFVGVAPEARIINVKVGATDGATDVSQVIAAIDWVSQHAKDSGFNIKVLSLSFGTDSTQAYTVDPLAQAAEAAWKRGVVVVAAAGNEGRASTTLADPAYDPYVIAVGAQDPNNTLAVTDDVVPSFAQHGTSSRPVDVIAPATHVLGLRVPGSFIDTLAANTGQVGRFQRGSGTSQATAITAGAVALLAQKYPSATPDQLKGMISGTATPLTKYVWNATFAGIATALGMSPDQYLAMLNTMNSLYSGHGIVNVQAAAATSPLLYLPQAALPSLGTGTLEAARGGVYVSDNGVNLTGEKDIFGKTFNSTLMASSQTVGTAWVGGTWNGSRWTGDLWSGSRWTNVSWTGSNWAGSRWTGSRWTGMTWDGSRWTGTGWNGSRWTGSTWDGSRWSSVGWN
jgi:serine protease AprX